MATRTRRLVENILEFLIAIAILPSLVALSSSYAERYPDFHRWSGPLNLGKLLLPGLLLWLFFFGFSASKSLGKKVIVLAWLVGTLSTLWGAYRCDFTPLFIREWINLSLGLGAGYFLSTLDGRRQDRVFVTWFGAVAVSVMIALMFPAFIDYLYANFFDPETRKGDLVEAGDKVLTGIFGRQSLAKLMAWTPWLALPYLIRVFKTPFVPSAGIGLFSGLILATSQRGPTLAAFIAMAAFGVHRLWHTRRLIAAIPAFVAIVVASVSLFLFVPPEILRPRVAAVFVEPTSSTAAEREHISAARSNAGIRGKMAIASLAAIQDNPLGNACLPESFFREHDLFVSHSHSLFLEQFRSRGWVWGLLHLGLWLVAGLMFWRRSDARSAAFFAGWTAVMISGLFDHPWFVLNQALVLGVFLVFGLLGNRFQEQASTRF